MYRFYRELPPGAIDNVWVSTVTEADIFKCMFILCIIRMFYFRIYKKRGIVSSIKLGLVGFCCALAYHDVLHLMFKGYAVMLTKIDVTYGFYNTGYQKGFGIYQWIARNYRAPYPDEITDFSWIQSFRPKDMLAFDWWDWPWLTVNLILGYLVLFLNFIQLGFISNSLLAIYSFLLKYVIDYKTIVDLAYFIDYYIGWHSIRATVIFGFMVRMTRSRWPYAMRWHWSICQIYDLFLSIWVQFCTKLYQRGYASAWVRNFCHLHMVVTIGSVIIMMLYAVSFQYYYVPFFTETGEMHSGPKLRGQHPDDGGYCSWQDIPLAKRNRLRLWWGWLGKSKNDREKEKQKKSNN